MEVNNKTAPVTGQQDQNTISLDLMNRMKLHGMAEAFRESLAGTTKVCRNARCTSFLFITIQICSFSLSCDLLKISLIYVFPASKNSSCKLIKQSNQPVHTLFCQFCTHLFYIEGNG